MTNRLVKADTGTQAWDAGAVSSALQDDDMAVTFTLVGGSQGIMAGLAAADAPLSKESIQQGVLARAGQLIQIIESGDTTATSNVVFNSDVQVQVGRAAGAIYFQVGDWTYTSENFSYGVMRLMALLYAPGDAIDTPGITQFVYEPPSLDNSLLTNTLTLSDSYTADSAFYGDLLTRLYLSDEFAGNIEWGAEYTDFLLLHDAYTADAEYEAILSNTLWLKDGVSALSQGLLQYATNLDTGAVTRYSGFDFEGFCRVGVDTYGWKKDGLYRIEGDSDNGLPISALVDLAAEALAAPAKTRLVAVFLGLRTDGQVFLRVLDEHDAEVTYRARCFRDLYRVNPYKGLSARYWRVRLEVMDATELELDSVEWVAPSTGRRTTY